MILTYRALNLIFLPIFLFFALIFSPKFRKWLKRKSNLKRNSLKSIWVHTSSGEFEHAIPLIRYIKAFHPTKKIVITYSSPSYMNAIINNPHIDAYEPYPLDLKNKVYDLIKKVNPELVLFSKTDLWPELMHQLKVKKIPSVVFARTESKHLSFFKKIVYNLTFKKASHISFISKKDREFYSLPKPTLSVDGDPRVDEVFYKQTKLTKPTPIKKSLILGSVWKEDLSVISKPILSQLKSNNIEKLIIAPHEPSKKNINDLLKQFKEHEPSLFSEDPNLLNKVVIVDSLGKLFSLYSQAQVAFIGGSYKKKVHSVIEPLSFGLPVLIGPKYKNNTEAKIFSQNPYNFVRVCESASDFEKELIQALNSPPLFIKKELENLRGATQNIYELIKPYISL